MQWPFYIGKSRALIARLPNDTQRKMAVGGRRSMRIEQQISSNSLLPDACARRAGCASSFATLLPKAGVSNIADIIVQQKYAKPMKRFPMSMTAVMGAN